MADTHPFRTAADVVDANVTEAGITETFLDALKKRVPVTFSVTEEVSTFNFSVGSPPLALLNASTGYVYFLNPDDTTTAPDTVSFTVLVTEDGRRYILADSSTVAVSSVLGIVGSPPDGSPDDAVVGDAYVVSDAPTGEFAAHAKDIALLTPRGWVFAQPKVGTALLNEETGLNIQYSSAGVWGAMATALDVADVAPEALLFPMGLSVEAQQNDPPVSPSEGQHYLVGTAGSGLWSGHSNEIAYYTSTSVWAFLAAYDGATIFNKAADTALTWFDSTGDWRAPWPYQATCQGRLTLESGVPISTTDQTAKATLYLTPFRGNNISLYANGGWALRTFTEKSLSLAGYTTGKPFDIFAYDNAGVVAIESLVWTDDTTRATALALQDGILVKTGDATRRYLGTIYTTAIGQTEDSRTKRMVWNYYNRVRKSMRNADETTSSWTYNSATIRQARGSTSNQLEFVLGVDEEAIEARLQVLVSGGSNRAAAAIGLDSTTAVVTSGVHHYSETLTLASPFLITATYVGHTGSGRHRVTWLEKSVAASTVTYFGTNSADSGFVQSGISGTLLG